MNLWLWTAVLLIEVTGEVEWWQKTVIYQIYPRSFKDSDGDGIGDLRGIESKLDYLRDLGIGCIWLSPIFKSPMKDFGYDVSDYYDIDPLYGSLDDFDSLISAVKLRGMKLVLDIVPQHTSDQHPWFQKSLARQDPYTDYYIWADPKGFQENGDPIPPNNWISRFRGSVWQWSDRRRQFYLHTYLKEQPDTNAYNEGLNNEFETILQFWLDRGVDGFRVDAINQFAEVEDVYQNEPISGLTNDTGDWKYLKHTLTVYQPRTLQVLRNWRQILDNNYSLNNSPKIMMTEVPENTNFPNEAELLMQYYGTDEEPIAHFTFNFRFIEKTLKSGPPTAAHVKEIVKSWFRDRPRPTCWANWLVGNHDNRRVATRFGVGYVDIMNMIILLLPGTAIVYNGDEIGMEDTDISFEDTVDPRGCRCGPQRYKICSRDPERTPMQWSSGPFAGFTDGNVTWLPVNQNYPQLNVAAQEEDDDSHLAVFRQLVQLRNLPLIQEGELHFCDDIGTTDVFVFLRKLGDHGIAVAVNLGNDSVRLNLSAKLPAKARVLIRSSHSSLKDRVKPNDITSTFAVPVGAKEGIVLEFPVDFVEHVSAQMMTQCCVLF
ncbi:unnamed protein product [Cyprideis torosa]|uniref:alpha-glucosidase n=1 Tax=Cyprideis torosa TaxID=163714 RepID=A0A7R8WDN8_9CRUS|nr:unnamed protein product [Cyprideis torosa]CAG0888538.1 unnamed protein product [Cyprideis torosa]